MKYYFIMIWDDVTSEMFGPFDNNDIRDGEARKKVLPSDKHGVYWLNQAEISDAWYDSKKNLAIGGYNGFFVDRDTPCRIEDELKVGDEVTIVPLEGSKDIAIFNTLVVSIESGDMGSSNDDAKRVEKVCVARRGHEVALEQIIFPAIHEITSKVAGGTDQQSEVP